MRQIIFLAIFLVFARVTLAQGEFITSYNVGYRVSSDGLTRSRLEVDLTNRLSNIYASEFTLSIGSTNLSDVSLTLPSGTSQPKVEKGSKTTNITVVFPEKVLGKDKSQHFVLEFTTTDFARRLGNVWEVSIPRLSRSESLDQYSLVLTVPADFGLPASITPAPSSQAVAGSVQVFKFDSQDLLENGISATFGREQWYDFSLIYHLANTNIYPIETEIALPPDTAWQQVLYQTIEPKPVNIKVDADGNWLAAYKLGPQAKLDITATGSATLFLNNRADYIAPEADLTQYIKPRQYWESDSAKIKAAAAGLTTPRKIYQYVVTNLIYDYGRLGETPTRMGAANILDNQNSALCMEFTDLFIALSRAAGIPARAVNGYAYTDNSALRPLSLKQDVLHAWPEYYDAAKQLWRPVDPTWGNTTGGVDYFEANDLNHFSFVIQGENSSYPIPAGAYKLDDSPAKNVNVVFGKSVGPAPAVELILDLPEKSLAGVGLNGKIVIKNSGNTALYRVPVELVSRRFKLDHGRWEIESLPPKSYQEISFSLPATAWNSSFSDTIRVKTELTEISKNLEVTPAYRLIPASRSFRLIMLSLAGLIVLKLIYARLVQAKPVK